MPSPRRRGRSSWSRAQAQLVGAALAGLSLNLVYAPDFAAGLAASLRAGVMALPEEAQALLLILGDMPLVEPKLLDQLGAAFDPQAGYDIVVPVWHGRRGNPRLWGRRCFGALLSLSGDAGANRMLADYPASIKEIPALSDSVLRDFNTQEDLDIFLAENRSAV